MPSAEPLPIAVRPDQENDMVIVQRDGTRRVIRHRRYLRLARPEATPPRLPGAPPAA
ncbi:MAG TPA: hypothetical protein VGI06_05585 [Acidimicrobiales bacterium]|jgi:hypothetical protein